MSELSAVEMRDLEARADSLVANHEALLKSLVQLRQKHGLTQADVAERMNVSQPTVAAFERYDANPTLSTIRRYAMAVGARIRDEVLDDCCPSEKEQFFHLVGESFRMNIRRPVQWNVRAHA